MGLFARNDGWQGSPAALRAYRMLAAPTFATFLLLLIYLCTRLANVVVARGYTTADRVMAALLLAAELFLCIQGIGFFASMLKASRHQARTSRPAFAPLCTAPVAVVVACYNESEDVLEQTIASVRAMDYPALHVYLLDDSARAESREGARRLADKYGLTLVRRENRAGYKAGAINDLLPALTEPYLAILDADQRPLTAWLKDVVPHLEADPRLALVQVPQIYANTEGLPVAEAAKYQQAVFFEYICEGKAVSNAIFCCGSNVVMRRTALLSLERQVGGRRMFFDETSVTEDFATTVDLHARGWRTAYVNEAYVVGMGPETLPAYFTQQMRWAMGTLGVGLRTLRRFWRDPRALSPAQWWEYLLSGTYYFVGIANVVFMSAPVAFVFLDVRPIRGTGEMYALLVVPYIALTMNLFFLGMRLRGHAFRGIWLASALSFGTFWTYARAATVAVFGVKRAFGVTPKGIGGAIPVRGLLPELTVLLANVAAALVGFAHLAGHGLDGPWLINTVWAAYHAALLSVLFLHFNRRVEIPGRPLLFDVARAA